MKYLDLHGDRVAYREAGAGEALLLIHGMAGSSATWRAVLVAVAEEFSDKGWGTSAARSGLGSYGRPRRLFPSFA